MAEPFGAELRAARHEHFDRIDISWLFPPDEDELVLSDPVIRQYDVLGVDEPLPFGTVVS